MKLLKWIDRLIMNIEEKILSYSILLMAFILIGNVISRTFFNYSWHFAEEAGQFLVIAITFIGISYGARKGRHISMTAVIDLSPPKIQKALILIISAVTSVTLFYLAILGIEYTLKVEALGRVTPALRVPMYLVVMFIPIGFILGGIQYARNFWINLKAKPALTDETASDRNMQQVI
ncbi:TRAP transporter small permease [Ammoniphilus sp. YIM 78166]|uniref:TRAP transporter small permease n=1 Tax=Ammoniphilus sp. YIM 78166 TaxID=1644106 RepID=UPI00106F7408|nr:TRAP transporter small permease [Ammoniphilus sp. YIM 78166]